ncbi:DUF6095 family protein [Muriicola sp. Z0-33]|uniref:DUF6095 family protein n=1 Tax=Muriicola sp. Z0-33 TaxID=2816957 RepID=UPI0022386A78|nr:DUF6095 family protein [Muriicola sp. Z0-33]MCW5517292.1 hypothetical protein [Muriicola sp. Z0-33]
MKTDKSTLIKGVKYLAITILLMFLAPGLIYQAFKNQDNPLFWPVLILGIIFAIGAISLGFYGIKVLMDAFFGKKSSSSSSSS